MATPAQDLNDKLKLERQLLPKIRGYNRKISRDFIREWGVNGTIPNFNAYDEELSIILHDHYLRVEKLFSNRIRDELPEEVGITDAEAAEINAALAILWPSQARESAKAINDTTRNDANEAVDFARDEQTRSAAEGRTISKLEAATIAGAALYRGLTGRAISIATTETQKAAEVSKATEAEVLSGLSPSVSERTPRKSTVKKEWVTVGDSRVREAHLEADGQQRNMNAPFDVGGEQLQYPGDRTLGASLGNVINCRCSAGYDTQGIIDTRKAQEREA